RPRLATPLLILLAAPYALFMFNPSVPLAAALALLASIGFGASLIHQHHLTTLTPTTLTGHALGLHSSGMLTLQALAATLAGTLAQLTSPPAAIALLALTSLTATALLRRADRRNAADTLTPEAGPAPDRS
ncbi:MFS transporter, partial [Streptomyces sp. 15-116A]|nr:MFS transporter [Streptomyces sp. 15-116A]